MKKQIQVLLIKFLILQILLCFSAIAFCQTNSVVVKNASGIIISNHNSIQSAYNIIPDTLTQGYIIELNSNYLGLNEIAPINFFKKFGVSAINTITLRPAAGITSISLSKSASTTNIITFDDADFITIDGRAGGIGNTNALTISNTSTASTANNIVLINGSCNNKIEYCNFLNGGGNQIFLSTSDNNPTGNSNNKFNYNFLTGGRNGFNLSGGIVNFNKDNTIFGCRFVDITFTGISISIGNSKTKVDSCIISQTQRGTDGPTGIRLGILNDTTIISNNKIYDLYGTSVTPVTGILLQGWSRATNNYLLIHNNFISLTVSNALNPVYGIDIRANFNGSGADSGRVDIYYNSINLGGSFTDNFPGEVLSAAINKTSDRTGSKYRFINNILVSSRTGTQPATQHMAMAITNTAGTFTSDYNTYNRTGTLIRYGATVYNSFAAYQAAAPAGSEANSNAEPVQFVSNTDLHLTGTSIGNIQLKALPIAGITKDIDFEIRDIIPYRGADEVTSAPLPILLNSLNVRRVNKDVLLSWVTSTEVNNRGFEIERSTDGNRFTSAGFVAGAGNSTTTKNYTFTDPNAFNLYANKLYYRLKQIDTDGRIRYSPIVMVRIDETKGLIAEIFPNPVSTYSNLKVNTDKTGNVSLSIKDISGKVVALKTFSINSGSNIISVPEINKLQTGTYIISVMQGGEQTFIKIIKK